MFVFWGTKVTERRLGRRADYCPLCRAFRPFVVDQVETVGHLYYIPLGRRQVIGHVKRCEACGVDLAAELDEALGASRERGLELPDLIARTNPQIEKQWADRLALEQRIKARQLTSEERSQLLMEPFVLLNRGVEARTGEVHLDRWSGLGCLSIVAMVALFFATEPEQVGLPWSLAHRAALWGLGGAALLTLLAMSTGSRRFVRREILPRLARALRPLDPTRAEIEQTIGGLKSMNWAIARRIRTDDLMAALASEPLDSP